MTTLFPYPTLLGEIGIEVLEVVVDGSTLPYAMISKSQRSVALHQVERSRWEEAHLTVRVTGPQRELAEGPWSEVACVAVLTEGTTNARSVQPLQPDGPGTWSGTVELLRNRHREQAVLTASAVAEVDGVAGRLIGSAVTPWIVDLKASAPARHRDLNLVEVDFRDGPDEWLRPFKDAPWLVDTSGEMPTIHLNTAFEGLIELLRESGGPLQKATGGIIAAQIAHEMWTAMFHTAVGDLELDQDGTPLLPGGWRESVLRAMLPDVVPGMSLTDALYEVRNRRADGHGWAELQSSIQYAASRRAQIPRNLTTALRVVDRSEEGAGR